MRSISLALPFALVLGSACGPAASSHDTTDTTNPDTTSTGSSNPPPARAWLDNIRQGDQLTYEVTTRDQASSTVVVTVERLERSADRTAACMVPSRSVASTTGMDTPHWLVGDINGLSRIEVSATGCTASLGETSSDQVWRLPSDWSDLEAHQSHIGSWSIDELDLRVEGPIRGDRCARFVTEEPAGKTYLVVCANVGMAELERVEPGDFTTERWRLISITSPVQRLNP